MRLELQAQTVIDGGDNFRRIYGPFYRITANFIALAHNATALYAAAGKIYCPALWPVIASAGGIYFRCATKFGEARNQGFIEQAALDQVFEQGAVTLVIHWRDDIAHALDRGERF